jgi:Histidine kinase-, DNA gyrase B-, and HSP90-like ATPase
MSEFKESTQAPLSGAAERMRRMRERRKGAAAPILYERPDWRLFIDKRTLPQKAGCEPAQIGRVVLKELVDNALDADAGVVTLAGNATSCTVRDDGPGIVPFEVPRLFTVNRPLLSSKLKRLPTRGMLGNGLRVVMGAVAAYGGSISVTTRGRRCELVIDTVTGVTEVTSTAAADRDGVAVEVAFPCPMFSKDDYAFAEEAIDLAQDGEVYGGPSMRSWYGSTELEKVIAAAPKDISRDEVLYDLFGSGGETEVEIGELGDVLAGDYYRKVQGTAAIEGAIVPFCIEVWVDCEHAEKGDNTAFLLNPLINRSPSLAYIRYWSDSAGLALHGCGLDFKIPGAKRGDYTIEISLITPYLRLTGDGKAPYLGDFREAMIKAVTGAAGEAYRMMIRPPTTMSIKDAAYQVMRAAYLKASDNGTLPAKARQIMYAARGEVLRLTGKKAFGDKYFTQVLLPDYVNDNPEETADWDVVYDARGNLTEPHTDQRIPLGTIQVRQYLGQRPTLHPASRLETDELYPTSGPRNRYRNILFIEKEGFDELFEAVQLAARFDLAIMSTKGLSVVAARKLLDLVAGDIDNVFILHDFDISGFSIAGTLGTDSRRYTFDNAVPIIDIGLRLEDVEAMGLEAETVKVDNVEARQDTLAGHGATEEEIEFLAEPDGDGMCRRVELNAMTSRQLVDFVEEQLRANGVEKVLPDDEVLKAHARRLITAKLTRMWLNNVADDIARQTAATELPDNLEERVQELLEEHSALSWDQALAQVVARES